MGWQKHVGFCEGRTVKGEKICLCQTRKIELYHSSLKWQCKIARAPTTLVNVAEALKLSHKSLALLDLIVFVSFHLSSQSSFKLWLILKNLWYFFQLLKIASGLSYPRLFYSLLVVKTYYITYFSYLSNLSKTLDLSSLHSFTVKSQNGSAQL